MTTSSSLDNFGFLSIRGKDALKFLQGYTTCDLEDISATRSGLGAICNIQGRMIASFRIVESEDGFLLRMSKSLIPATIEFLQKYIVFSKATMSDVSGELGCYGVIGEVDDYPATRLACVQQEKCHVIRVSDTNRFEVWGPTPPGFPVASETDWLLAEISDGFAWVTEANAGEFIPQMFDYHRTGGVDFDKGCYLGQEIVARMQYRGSLNRKLHRGITTGSAATGDLLFLTSEPGRSVGQVVSSAGQNLLAVVQSKDDALPECQLADGTTVELMTIDR